MTRLSTVVALLGCNASLVGGDAALPISALLWETDEIRLEFVRVDKEAVVDLVLANGRAALANVVGGHGIPLWGGKTFKNRGGDGLGRLQMVGSLEGAEKFVTHGEKRVCV